jgi:protein TonB
MDAKKTKKADIQPRRILFFEAGFAFALMCAVGAFAWGTSEKSVEVMTRHEMPVTPDVVINTEHKPAPPKVLPRPVAFFTDIIQVKRNEDPIDTPDWIFPDSDDDVLPLFSEPVEEEGVGFPIYNAEVMPSFEGGTINDFRNWVQSRVVYPRMAIDNGVHGKVVLKFVIELDGSLSNIEQIASPDPSLTEEAIRVLHQSPKWSPGKQRNKPVRVFYVLPVEFQLQGN